MWAKSKGVLLNIAASDWDGTASVIDGAMGLCHHSQLAVPGGILDSQGLASRRSPARFDLSFEGEAP